MNLNVRVHNNKGGSDWYDMTPKELNIKCYINANGQLGWKKDAEHIDDCNIWHWNVTPYEIYNYECYNWWECDYQTIGIITTSRISKYIKNHWYHSQTPT